jgi:hypothetical protein
MLRIRGIVLEVEKNNVTVLTPDGRYRRLPRLGNVQIGQEYCHSTSARPWMAAAAMFMLLFASSLYYLAAPAAPVAYVTVDINPSLELGVSARLNVVSVQALNEDAAILLSGLKLKGQSLDEALENILEAAKEKQYLNTETSGIVISGSPAGNKEAKLGQIELVLENTVEKFLSENASEVAVAVVTANRTQREEAQELGLSVGKYTVYRDAQDRGINLQAEELQTKGIGRSLLDLEEHPGEVLREIDRKKDLPVPAAGKKPENPGNAPDRPPGQGPPSVPPGKQQKPPDHPSNR